MDWLERWLFQSKEENTEQDQDQEAEIPAMEGPSAQGQSITTTGSHDNIVHGVIATPDMIRERFDFSRDYWRSLVRDTKPTGSLPGIVTEPVRVPQNVSIQAPSSGDEYLYYAQ